MLIDLIQLRTFVAVAQEQHLTRAAERLHMSQSAASAHVRAVEEQLKTQLFSRTNRNMELTAAGRLLFDKAQVLLNEAAQFTSFARELRGDIQGTLVVGASSDPASSRIGLTLAALRSRHPHVKVDLHARPSASTRQGLRSGELDAGLLLDRPTDSSLVYHALMSVGFRIAGPAAWKTQIEQADWAALAAMPWITPADESMAYTHMLDEMFGAQGLELHSVARFDNAALARSLVQAGVGLLLVRDEHAERGVQEGQLAVSPLGHPQFTMFLAHLKTRRNDPLIQAFVDAAAQAWPHLRPTHQVAEGIGHLAV